MAYWHRLNVPANTLESAPVEEFILLMGGILREIEIWFPSGCAGLVHLQVYDQAHQVYPRESGENFVGDDWHIAITEHLEISGEPWGLTLRAWSPGTGYEHNVYVHFEVSVLRLLAPLVPQFVEIPDLEV